MTDPSKSEGRTVGRVAFLFASVAAVTTAVIFLAAIWNVFYNLPQRGEILVEHFRAIIGMPAAGAIAFILVVFLRQTEGPMIRIQGCIWRSRHGGHLFSGDCRSDQIALVER